MAILSTKLTIIPHSSSSTEPDSSIKNAIFSESLLSHTEYVGYTVGCAVGTVGSAVGEAVGEDEGFFDGSAVVGDRDGSFEGRSVGASLGVAVGLVLGAGVVLFVQQGEYCWHAEKMAIFMCLSAELASASKLANAASIALSTSTSTGCAMPDLFWH